MFSDAEYDEDDGVVIFVDEENDFDLIDNEDLKKPFAYVSVRNDLYGNITISYYDDEEDEDIYLFNKELNDMSGIEDEERENFTLYKIALRELNSYLPSDGQIFTLAFNDEEYGEIDSRDYVIYMEGTVIRFEEVDDEEEDDDYGEYLENVLFQDGNTLTDDPLVIIPKFEIDKHFRLVRIILTIAKRENASISV